jgi:hypothetical protein
MPATAYDTRYSSILERKGGILYRVKNLADLKQSYVVALATGISVNILQ